jgi:hypothetical protein
MANTTTSFTNRSVTYKADGTTIDIVVDTTVDLAPPVGWTGTQDEFLEKCMPPRFRRWAEHFAELTEAERTAETGAWICHPAMDPGTIDVIDYTNSQLYEILRANGLVVTSHGATYLYVKIYANYAASGGGIHAGGSAGVLAIIGTTGVAAITLSGTVVRVVDRIAGASGVATTSGAMAAAAVDRICAATTGVGTLSGTATCTSIPKTVTGTSLAIGNTQLVLTWTDIASPAATGYKVFWLACPLGSEDAAAIEAGTEWVGAKDPAGTTITGLLNGTQYGVIVAGTNACTVPGAMAYNYGTVKYQTPSA